MTDPRFHRWQITPELEIAWHEAWDAAAIRIEADDGKRVATAEVFVSARELDKLAAAARDVAAIIRLRK